MRYQRAATVDLFFTTFDPNKFVLDVVAKFSILSGFASSSPSSGVFSRQGI